MLSRDEVLALDTLKAAQAVAVPDYVSNELGHIDEVASEALRRPALTERELLRARARAYSNALVDAVEADARGVTLPAYSLKAIVAIRAACAELAAVSGGDAADMTAMVFATRDRAIALQAWMRAAQHEAAE